MGTIGNNHATIHPALRWNNKIIVIALQHLQEQLIALFRHARVSSTYPCKMSVRPSVRPSVSDTFEFPFYQCLWSLYVKS